tara:strand:- start:79 stop:1431 length:1353 start_codon:yes stop_codon:yes gene_type:complete
MTITERALKDLDVGQSLNSGFGFTAVKRPNGFVDWIFRKRIKGFHNAPSLVMGQYPDMSFEDAIIRAKEWRILANKGIHPKKHEKETIRLEHEAQQEIDNNKITLREVWDQYEKRKSFGEKPNTDGTIKDRGYMLNAVYGDWMEKPISEVTSRSLEERHYQYSGQGGSRSTSQSALRYINPIFKRAVDLKYIPENPRDFLTDIIKMSSEKNKDSLTLSECHQLLTLIEQAEHFPKAAGFRSSETTVARQMAYDAIALLLLTGIRKSELLELEISKVYLSEIESEKKGSKIPFFEIITSKQRQPFAIPITPPVASVLGRRIRLAREKNSKYVFPSSRAGIRGDMPMRNTRNAYSTLKRLMGKLHQNEGNRISANVLRTAFASTAYSLGLTIEQINMITGHLGSIKELNRVATGNYLVVQAQAHLAMFELINNEMLESVPDLSETDDYIRDE